MQNLSFSVEFKISKDTDRKFVTWFNSKPVTAMTINNFNAFLLC